MTNTAPAKIQEQNFREAPQSFPLTFNAIPYDVKGGVLLGSQPKAGRSVITYVVLAGHSDSARPALSIPLRDSFTTLHVPLSASALTVHRGMHRERAKNKSTGKNQPRPHAAGGGDFADSPSETSQPCVAD